MRKAIVLKVAVLVIAIVFTSGTAFAGNEAPSGPHWNINIIGHPKGGIGGDYSSGHSIMIPLRNVPGSGELVCDDVNGVEVRLVDNIGQPTSTYEPTGARIYFVLGDHFEIIDRDATDSDGAKIMVPVGSDPVTGGTVVQFDVYIRVLGKPNQCMKMDAYFYDAGNNLWFKTGTVYVSRKTGKSTFVKANELFTICIWDTTTDQCAAYPSVFNDFFESYFWSWDILNKGTRLVQLRLYPK